MTQSEADRTACIKQLHLNCINSVLSPIVWKWQILQTFHKRAGNKLILYWTGVIVLKSIISKILRILDAGKIKQAFLFSVTRKKKRVWGQLWKGNRRVRTVFTLPSSLKEKSMQNDKLICSQTSQKVRADLQPNEKVVQSSESLRGWCCDWG